MAIWLAGWLGIKLWTQADDEYWGALGYGPDGVYKEAAEVPIPPGVTPCPWPTSAGSEWFDPNGSDQDAPIPSPGMMINPYNYRNDTNVQAWATEQYSKIQAQLVLHQIAPYVGAAGALVALILA